MSLSEANKHELIKELEQFHDGFARYKELVLVREEAMRKPGGTILGQREVQIQQLRLELERKYGSLKPIIEKHGSSTRVLLQGGRYECEAFTSAFSYKQFGPKALEVVMDTAIAAINTTIGKLQSLTLPETSQIQVPEDSAQMANFLFDKMQFHPKVVEASKSLFETGHYAQAIFEAFKAVNNFVKTKTGLPLDGKDLMAKVFREEAPIIRLNELKTTSERDEQEGFKFLFMGAMVGVRNPKAHDNIVQTDPYRTLEYLGFASLLMRRIEEGEVTPH